MLGAALSGWHAAGSGAHRPPMVVGVAARTGMAASGMAASAPAQAPRYEAAHRRLAAFEKRFGHPLGSSEGRQGEWWEQLDEEDE